MAPYQQDKAKSLQLYPESPTFATKRGTLLKSFDVLPCSDKQHTKESLSQAATPVQPVVLPPEPELTLTAAALEYDVCYRCTAVLLVLPTFCICLPLLVLDLLHRWLFLCCNARWDIGVRREWTFDIIIAIASGLLGCVRTSFTVGAGHYEAALQLSDRFHFPCVAWLITRVPWPVGRMTKVEAMAYMNRAADVARFTGLEGAASNSEARRAALDMWCVVWRKSCHRFDVVQRCVEGGADIDFPDVDGSTLLHCFVRHDGNSVRWLLSQNASPNTQDDHGDTPLHTAAAACAFRNSDVVLTLLRDVRTDPCIFNHRGLTPLMHRLQSCLPPEPLRPQIRWDAIEEALEAASADSRLSALLALVPERKALSALRLPDHLFCQIDEDDSEEELVRRRQCLWEQLLKPMMLDLGIRQELRGPERAMLLYVWDATNGPPKASGKAQKSYGHEVHLVLSQAEEMLVQELRQVNWSICNNPTTQRYLQLPQDCQVSPRELHHGRFHPAPTWALVADFVAAVRDLERLRILRSAEDLCDLMRLGRLSCTRKTSSLPAVGTFRSAIFTNRRRLGGFCRWRKSSSKLDFWMGLVALWLFALHRYLEPIFHRKVLSVVTSQELRPLQTRNFDWIVAEARKHITARGLKTWEEKVLAPLWIIDVLACTCEVTSAERAMAVEKALTMEFPLVCKESCYSSRDTRDANCFLYRKLILLLEADFTQLGHVNAIVEVKIFLTAHASIDRRMQLVRYARTGNYE